MRIASNAAALLHSLWEGCWLLLAIAIRASALLWWAAHLDWWLFGSLAALGILGTRWPLSVLYITPFVLRSNLGDPLAALFLTIFYARELWSIARGRGVWPLPAWLRISPAITIRGAARDPVRAT